MLSRCLIAATFLAVASGTGCQGPLGILTHVTNNLNESARFRTQMRDELQRIRDQEREALRQEIAAEHRRELDELKRLRGPTAAELTATLEQQLKQRITQTRVVVDRKAMEERNQMLARVDDESERQYQEELADYLRRESEHRRNQYQWVRLRQRQLAGDPSCRQIPPQPSAFKELPPQKPQPSNLAGEVVYKVEMAVQTGLDTQAITQAEGRIAPLKEMCPLPLKQDGCCDRCGKVKCACHEANAYGPDGMQQASVGDDPEAVMTGVEAGPKPNVDIGVSGPPAPAPTDKSTRRGLIPPNLFRFGERPAPTAEPASWKPIAPE